MKWRLLGKQGVGRMVEATAWMSLTSFCSPAYPPVRTEQKERLKDGKGVDLFKQLGVRAAEAMCLPLALVLASVPCAAGGHVLEGSHRNVMEKERLPTRS